MNKYAHVRENIFFGRMTKHKNTHYLYIVSINYVVSSNPAHSEGYPIQHCVIKFVGDLRQVDGLSGYSGLLHQQNRPPRYC